MEPSRENLHSWDLIKIRKNAAMGTAWEGVGGFHV